MCGDRKENPVMRGWECSSLIECLTTIYVAGFYPGTPKEKKYNYVVN
jgi:hypothetical protein